MNSFAAAITSTGLKLGSVLSGVLGNSGRAMLAALAKGQTDPVRLVDLAQGSARKQRPEWIKVLPACTVPADERLPRNKESDSCDNRLHAHRHLSQASRWREYVDPGLGCL